MGKRRGFLAAGVVLLACVVCTGIVAAGAPVIVFSDNFNDNSLDITKWTTDVAGDNNAVTEENGMVNFTTFGNYDGGWHAFLNSVPITITDWDTVEFTGNWTTASWLSRTQIATVTDLDNPANRISVEYNAFNYEMYYYWEGNEYHETTSVPAPGMVPFRLKINRTTAEYFEYDVLKASMATASMAGTTRFQLHTGAYDLSPYVTSSYIDEIVVRYIPAIPAVADIRPDTLYLKSKSDKNAVTASIELQSGDVRTIDPASVTLSYNGQHVHAQPGPLSIRDMDLDGKPELFVKFDRKAVAGILSPGSAVTLVVSGTAGGTLFTGSDTIRVA